MTKFTKFVLILGLTVLVLAATAWGVIYSFRFRGRFAFGGEWLIPGVVVLIWLIGREIKRFWRFTEKK